MKSSTMEPKMGDTKIALNITVISIFIFWKSIIQWKTGKDGWRVSRFTISNKFFQSFSHPKYKQKDESKYRIWWYSRNSSKTKVSYQQPQLQGIRRFFQVSITIIIIRFEFIINPRTNGEALPLAGGCKIHGSSKESITGDMPKVWYDMIWCVMLRYKTCKYLPTSVWNLRKWM